jgi:hypothetical protein
MTTKKTQTQAQGKLYRLTAGNIATRPGHRHDCAEVRITWHVWATSEEEAIRTSRELVKKSGVLPGLTIELGDISAKLQVKEDES